MAPPPNLTAARDVCKVCASVPWTQLQAEDVRGSPHQPSRRALEASAQSCVLCKMILRAAISHYRDARGRRHGKGYWTQMESITYQDRSGSREVMYIKEMGASMPVKNTDLRSQGGRPVIAATGMFDGDQNHVEDGKASSDLEAIEGESSTDAMPVWVYGNYWAESSPKADSDRSHLRLVGIGARFGRSESHFDAFNLPPGDLRLCGSPITVCATDGESRNEYKKNFARTANRCR